MKKFNKPRFIGLGVLATLGLVLLAYAASGTIWTLTGKGTRRNTVEVTLESPSLGVAAALLPGTDVTNDLGNTSYQWRNVYASTFNAAGLLRISAQAHQAAMGTTLTPTASYVTLTTSAGVTGAGTYFWSATPTISTTSVPVGTLLYLVSKSTRIITIQDEGTLAGSGLALGTTYYQLGPNDSATFILENQTSGSRVWTALSYVDSI